MSLTEKHCVACEGGVPKVGSDELAKLMTEVPGWELAPDQKSIAKRVQFRNYYETMAFVNAVAWIAHQEGHHPDLEVSYDRCVVCYSTHAVGGLTENDFICAAKVNGLS